MQRTTSITLGTITAALLLAAPARAQWGPDWGPPALPNLNGTWYMHGNPDQPTEILQRPSGRALFINEHGSRARGMVYPDRVFIPDWSDGSSRGLVGRVRGDRIVWPYGNFWSRRAYAPDAYFPPPFWGPSYAPSFPRPRGLRP